MAFVNESDEVILEIVNETERPLSGLPSVKISGIVLDSGAVAHLLHHFQVVFHPLLQSFSLQILSDALEILHLLHEVILNHADSLDGLLFSRHEVARRVDRHFRKLLDSSSRNRFYQ